MTYRHSGEKDLQLNQSRDDEKAGDAYQLAITVSAFLCEEKILRRPRSQLHLGMPLHFQWSQFIGPRFWPEHC